MEGRDEDRKKVTVAVRIRPKLGSKEKYEMATVNKADSNVCVCVNPVRLKEQTAFCFDYVLDEEDSQQEVYKVASDMTQSTLEGVDNVILTYGQTGSGKTYTLLGTGLQADGMLDDDSGIFLRVLFDLLAHRDTCKETHHLVIALSIIEIYNEQLKDLLNNKQVLSLKEVGDDVVVMRPTMLIISDKADVNHAFNVAIANRSVAPTLMNDTSSRSHALFMVDLYQQRKTARNPNPPDIEALLAKQYAQAGFQPGGVTSPLGAPGGRNERMSMRKPSGADKHSVPFPDACNEDAFPIAKSTLTMVDLAGSERAKKSGAQGAVLQEAVAVNKSLTSLGKVVNAIVVNSKHIPFRESRLTRILKSAFISGQSRTLLIANIAPADSSYNETSGTLHFADRIQNLKPPSGAQYRTTDSEKEMEYLKDLRCCAELGAELRTAQLLHPSFQHHLAHKTPGRRGELAVQVKNYRQLHQRREEADRQEYNTKLKRLVTERVSSMEEGRPGIAGSKKKLDELEEKLQTLDEMLRQNSAALTGVQQQVRHEEQAAAAPHREFEEVSNKAQAVAAALKDACATEAKLQAQIENVQKELDVFKMPSEEVQRITQSLAEEEAYEKMARQEVQRKRSWTQRMTELLTRKREVEWFTREVEVLRRHSLGERVDDLLMFDTIGDGRRKKPSKFLGKDPSEIPVVKGVAPLAVYFDQETDPIAVAPSMEAKRRSYAGGPNGRLSPYNEALKRKLCASLKRIHDAKLCCDEDGKEIFSVLAQVKLSHYHLATVSDLFEDGPWGDIQTLRRDSAKESVAFALRTSVLFPPSEPLLKRVQEDDLGVLEFVELLLIEREKHTEAPVRVLSEHP